MQLKHQWDRDWRASWAANDLAKIRTRVEVSIRNRGLGCSNIDPDDEFFYAGPRLPREW